MTRSERIKRAGDALASWVMLVSGRCAMSDEQVKSGGNRVRTWREVTAEDGPDAIGPGSHFFRCERFGEAGEAKGCDTDYGIDLAFWQMGHDGRGMTFRERLRRCWRIVRGHNPYSDMVILHPATARKLADALVGLADHIEATTDENHKTPEPE